MVLGKRTAAKRLSFLASNCARHWYWALWPRDRSTVELHRCTRADRRQEMPLKKGGGYLETMFSYNEPRRAY